MAILRAYELVPEAYGHHKKAHSQRYVEFAREKGTLFDKWSNGCKANDFNSLRELILLEEFKNCLPERIVLYINGQKVSSHLEAAMLADEYVLTHKTVFSDKPRVPPHPPVSTKTVGKRDERECFYCHRHGHLISNCPTLKRKELNAGLPSKGLRLINSFSGSSCVGSPDPCFEPFIFTGFVSLSKNLLISVQGTC